MPTFLGPPFPPTFNGWPPRMSPEDFEIWQRWRPAALQRAENLYFDVGLGLPDQLPRTDDVPQLEGWIKNNQKRADVIIEGAEIWLVELRFNASPNAIGRLIVYQRLLLEDYPFDRRKPLISHLVTNRRDPDVAASAAALGIVYVVA